MLKKRGVIIIVLFLVVIVSNYNVRAGPYGYGDTMELHYKIGNGNIVYGYGNGAKYATSLRPKNLNWGEWAPENRREVVDKTWEEIFGAREDFKKCKHF
jgi:hypothetical protein